MIRPMLESMTVNPGQGAHRVFGESEPSHRVVQTTHRGPPTQQRAPPVGSDNPQPAVDSTASVSAHREEEQPVLFKPDKVCTVHMCYQYRCRMHDVVCA